MAGIGEGKRRTPSLSLGVNDPDLSATLRPLSARSVLASVLLGTHPPTLPGRLLVAFSERFGVSNGTARVALSRMVDRGELTNDDGVYSLAGSLLERQQRQDRSRAAAPAEEWNGAWEQVVVTATGRAASERTQLRRHLGALGMGELRESVWMRPANLAADRSPSIQKAVADSVQWFVVEPVPVGVARGLAASCFDLDGWAAQAEALKVSVDAARGGLGDDDEALVDGFLLATAALHHLTHDPQLPPDLEPAGWPAGALRQSYADYQAAYQVVLSDFFRSA